MQRIHNREYLHIKLLEINQKDKLFYVGKILAKDMLSIYTVRPATYDIEKNASIANSFPNEDEYLGYLTINNAVSEKDFQRKYSEVRVNEISRFLNNQEYAFFPNTIISNCDLINDLELFDISEDDGIETFKNLNSVPSHLSFFYKENNESFLLIPQIKNSLLIIDGQHRLEGLKKASVDVQNNYELLVAFILGYDRSVIAQQFYTINYEQKPVNKSLLYHLMGEFSDNLDELTFMHKVVKALNELNYSPFFKRVKMLGSTPQKYDLNDKKLLSISLAFLIDALIKTISIKSNGGLYQPIFRYYFNKEIYRIEIIKVLINYFSAVSKLIPEWNDPSNSLISKGMGVGALLKVLQIIFPIICEKEWNYDPEKIETLTENVFIKYLDGIQNVDFNKSGKFGGIGSAGSINKIKEEVILNLNILGVYHNFKDFEQFYKQSTLLKYKNWLSKHI